ncbi:hypothetical protein [Thermococcus sp.]|uniref:hypothetical protein n=1 Tax=Thermococcus sp. TaxID=35749 RepID=UPI00262745C5|nr:hypothetical protein [Thermococcus sp.]
MPRGFGRGYGRFNGSYRGYRAYPTGRVYSLLDILLLIGILYFLVKLFLVALPYALGLLVLLIVREFIRPRLGTWFGPF